MWSVSSLSTSRSQKAIRVLRYDCRIGPVQSKTAANTSVLCGIETEVFSGGAVPLIKAYFFLRNPALKKALGINKAADAFPDFDRQSVKRFSSHVQKWCARSALRELRKE